MELKLKTPWRDGTTLLVMSPLEFMQRLAALVPRPRLHLIRYHGVLAPNARLRPLVVPQEPEVQERAAEVAVASECDVQEAEPSAHCWAGGSGTRQERAWRRRPAADQPTSTWASNR